MKKNFVEELNKRGMIHDIMPGTEEHLQKEMTTAYIGFDPTADSLHIGSLVPIMILKHFQLCGHKPLALMGGATGMIGDPSGRSEERNLLGEDTLKRNLEGIKKQLMKFLDFDPRLTNCAEIVNNFDWMKDYSFLAFIRDIGKHLTVNYMMAKDSVKKRLETGISFTEFSYQLVQAFDFYHLYTARNCKLQMGGSDQWGNITAGTELIRRKDGGEAFALTCPLVTKADGGKFGKTESGNIWLDPRYTSPYKFYQFWLNATDADAENWIKRFTLLPMEEIEALASEHRQAPHLRLLQKRLAQEVTTFVHSPEDCQIAQDASEILFGKGAAESLKKIPEDDFLSIFDGVPQFLIDPACLDSGIHVVELTAGKTQVFESKGEARRMIKNSGLSINQVKITDAETIISREHLLNGKFILVQKGKKNYCLLRTE